jgi:tetratricopeptide (TPR) repeat protein
VYEGSRPDSAVLAGIVEHRADFPPMDRLLIESRLAGSLSGELAILQDATTRFPTYWPAKYALADALVHRAPLLGSTFQEARAALGRVLELNPQFFPAWDHLFWYGAYLKDSALAAHAFAALEELAASGSFRMTQDRVRYYETALSLARHDGRFTRERLAADADFLLTASQVAPIYLGYGLLDFRFPQAQIELNQEVLARDPPRGLAGAMWFGLGLSWATRGAWAEALAAIRQWLRLTDLREAPVVAYGLAVIGVRFGSVDPTTAAALRPAGPSVAESAEARAELAWLDGILAHAREDRAGLAAARQAVRIAGGRFSDLLEESLAAFALDLEGRAADAARRLTSLEWESAEAQRYHQYARPHPFFTSVNRLTAARQLLAAGDTAQAGRLLTWTDAVLWNAHGFMDPLLAVFEPLAVFERARIAAAQSRTSEAVWLYRRFLEQYDRPEGGWAARVEEAVGAVSR